MDRKPESEAEKSPDFQGFSTDCETGRTISKKSIAEEGGLEPNRKKQGFEADSHEGAAKCAAVEARAELHALIDSLTDDEAADLLAMLKARNPGPTG